MSAPAAISPFAIATVRLPDVTPFPLIVNAVNDEFIGRNLLDCGNWEWAESSVISRLLRPGQRAVDVGANLGYYTVLCANRVGPTGEVWAFEPDPANFRLLAANVALNGCSNVALMQAAAGDHRGQTTLHLSSHNLGDHRVVWQPQASSEIARETVTVEIVTLDECLPDQRVDIVKIDTQGAEISVLRGMTRLIDRNRDHLLMMIEFAPGLLRAAGRSVADYTGLLVSLGARAMTIQLDGTVINLRGMSDLESECARLAETLSATGREDESRDLFVCFSDAGITAHFGSVL